MTLHVFKDGSAAIVGAANNKIESSVSGTLSIGASKIHILANTRTALPTLGDGSHPLSFTAEDGKAYDGGYISSHRGRLIPHTHLTPRECELTHRLDCMEELYEDLAAKYNELYNKYNTNALNFLSET